MIRSTALLLCLTLSVLLCLPAAATADAGAEAASTTTVRTPDQPTRSGKPGQIPGEMSVSANCCKPPGPDGLHCCDTRDCGWFDCDAMRGATKTYLDRQAAKPKR